MPRGGARAGAGRKPGQRNAKTLELLKQAAALGITPLQVMLENMKTCYVSGDLQGAHKAAVDAAPYLHAKLVSSQVTVRRPDEMSDDELIAAIAVDEALAKRGIEAARYDWEKGFYRERAQEAAAAD